MEGLAGKVVLLWGWRRALVAFAAGAVAVLAQAPYDFPAACFLSFPILVWLLDGAAGDEAWGLPGRLARSFAVGWWFGFGYFIAGLWWVGNALLVDAENFAWAVPLAVAGLPALLAVFYGIATAVSRLFWTDGLGRIAALAFGFGLAEWLRNFVLTGFPWNAIGAAAMPTPLMMQSSAVIGVAGMNAAAVFVFAAPALLASRGRVWPGLAAALALVALHLGFGYHRLAAADQASATRVLSVRIVQPAIDQSQKWNPQIRTEILETHLRLTQAPPEAGSQPALVLWPETAFPYLLTERSDALAAIGAALGPSGRLMLGAVRGEGEPSAQRYYNSVALIDTEGQIVDAADKVHLVPFGEYLPFEETLARIGLTKIVETPISFSAGATRRIIEVQDGVRALPLICYEVIFPSLAAADAANADIIVNVTNDAWFGDTPGPLQHFRQAQLLAVQTGLPLVRAANNGVSGAVDPFGRVIDALALDVRAHVDIGVPIVRAETAPVGDPRLNGLVTVLFFGLLAGGFRVR